MSAIIIGKHNEYVVDAAECTEDHHECVHDWRIRWGNVDRTAFLPEDQ